MHILIYMDIQDGQEFHSHPLPSQGQALTFPLEGEGTLRRIFVLDGFYDTDGCLGCQGRESSRICGMGYAGVWHECRVFQTSRFTL